MWVLDSMGFNMFSKKKKDIQGKLTVFHLKLNVDEISTYLKGKCVVTPDKGNNWKHNDKVKSYDVTYLGTDPFIFYHKNANEFASSINGRDCVNDGEIDIEWEWVEGYFLAKAASETNNLIMVLDDLAKISRFSTARYLQLILMLLNGDRNSVSKLNDIISCPQNPPKEKDMDDSYNIRGELLKNFFVHLKSELVDTNGVLKTMSALKRIEIYKKLAASKEYTWASFADFMELDAYFNP
jgi:hypothetical protein